MHGVQSVPMLQGERIWLRPFEEFSIFIADKELWGKGYGTEALHAMLDFGFGELPLERIWLKVNSDNARAIASYTKAAFVKEGVLRHDRRHRGRFVDTVLMSLLREEWAASPRPKVWQAVADVR